MHNSLVIAADRGRTGLLVGPGLLIRSFVRVLQVDPGFDRKNVLTASLALPEIATRATSRSILSAAPAALAGVPRRHFRQCRMAIAALHQRICHFVRHRRTSPAGRRAHSARVSVIEPGYFQTMGIPLFRGREFQDTETTKSNPVVVVNQAFVKKFFPGSGCDGQTHQSRAGRRTVERQASARSWVS